MISMKFIMFTHWTSIQRKFENIVFVAEITSYDNMYNND